MFKKYSLISFCIIPIILGLFTVSLLGENHRATNLVDNFLYQLQARNFSSNCARFQFEDNTELSRNNSCEERNFLLFLSLQSLSNSQNGDFRFNAHIDKYWLPYTSNTELLVSVELETESQTLYFEKLFAIKRQNWSWKLTSINISNQALLELYAQFAAQIDFHKYTALNESNLVIKKAFLKSGTLTETDKELLQYSLQKIADYIGQPTNAL